MIFAFKLLNLSFVWKIMVYIIDFDLEKRSDTKNDLKLVYKNVVFDSSLNVISEAQEPDNDHIYENVEELKVLNLLPTKPRKAAELPKEPLDLEELMGWEPVEAEPRKDGKPIRKWVYFDFLCFRLT